MEDDLSLFNLSLKGPYGRRPIEYKRKSSMLSIPPLATQNFEQPSSNSLKSFLNISLKGPMLLIYLLRALMEEDL